MKGMSVLEDDDCNYCTKNNNLGRELYVKEK